MFYLPKSSKFAQCIALNKYNLNKLSISNSVIGRSKIQAWHALFGLVNASLS